jgi:hypothetical protein
MTAVGQPRRLLEVLHDINELSDLLEEPNDVVRAALAEIIPLMRPAVAEQADKLKLAA